MPPISKAGDQFQIPMAKTLKLPACTRTAGTIIDLIAQAYILRPENIQKLWNSCRTAIRAAGFNAPG